MASSLRLLILAEWRHLTACRFPLRTKCWSAINSVLPFGANKVCVCSIRIMLLGDEDAIEPAQGTGN